MTRKDYEAIARAIAQTRDLITRPVDSWTVDGALDRAAMAIADALETDNERFDRERFLTAARG